MRVTKTIDEYISDFPDEIREILERIRRLIQKIAPAATETISYGIPTFKLHGFLIHFAGYKNHIGIYPGSQAIADFEKELEDFETSKGTVRLPLDKPMPYDLIKKIVEYKVKQANMHQSSYGKKLKN